MDKDLPVTVVDTAAYALNSVIKSRAFPNSQLIYCKEGCGEIFSENALPMQFSKGDVIYISPSRMHGFCLNNAELILISFTGRYELYIADFFHFDGTRVINNCIEYKDQFNQISQYRQDDNYSEINLSALLYELIANLGIKVLNEKENTAPKDGYIVETIINYIIENFSKSTFSIASMLTDAGIDKSYAENLFQKQLGMSIDKYFLFFRLENLRNVLFLRPHLDKRRCAVTNGFTSYEEFEREFIAAYEISPEEFTRIAEH